MATQRFSFTCSTTVFALAIAALLGGCQSQHMIAENVPPPAGRIIAARRYRVKPMTPEEAAMTLAEDSNQFVVFRDSDTSRLSVLYKRRDGNFGLIQP